MKVHRMSVLGLGLALLNVSVAAPISGGSLYSKIFNASAKTAKERTRLFTAHYNFNPRAIDDVWVGMDGVWARHVTLETKTGSSKFLLSDTRAGLQFKEFSSKHLLSADAYREVDVARVVEGRSWAPEFGAAVVPDASSRTGWSNALYPAPREGRRVYYTVYERQTERFTTTSFLHARVEPEGQSLRVSMAHKVEEDVVVPGSSEWTSAGRIESDWTRALVTRPLFGDTLRTSGSRRIVYSEVQQTGPGQGYVLVVTDTGAARLEGAVHELRFSERSLEVGQRPIAGSLVYVERSTFGLDLPARSSRGASRAGRVIQD